MILFSPVQASDNAGIVEGLATGRIKPEGLSEYQREELLVSMAKRLVTLEARLAAVEKRLTDAGKTAATDDAKERIRKASLIFAEIQRLHGALRFDQVKAGLDSLGKQYPEVVKAKAFRKLSNELKVIGRDAGILEIERWFQGETTMDQAGLTLVVFFESWCPHCQDEMPKMEKLYNKYLEKGVNVIGLTKIADPATVTSVIGFIADKGLTFSVAKYGGAMAERFGVEGIPASALVKSGKIIWRGNPELISDQTIEIALAQP
ncbi:MAG: TlpA disulfide reductase family protein [Acidobacteriota bacterium]|nr:TlpA disulfide reductase family protein [Acidobacteriota bacterium]